MGTPEGTIRRYPLFAGLSYAPFMIPVIVLFWEQNGLDTSDIFLLQSGFALAMVLLEVPTGLVADRIGKRASLLAGQIVVVLGSLIYALGTGFWSFLAAEVVLALGMALLSGADAALLYDSLKRLGREREFSAIEGRAHAIRLLVLAATHVIGGLIGARSPRATAWASLLSPSLAVFVVLGFADAEPPPARGLREALRGHLDLSREALRFLTRHRLVRWMVLFQAVITASATWGLWSYQPYLSLVGMPVWSFGLVFACYSLVAAAASRLADRVAAHFAGERMWLLLALLQALPPLGMGLFAGPWAWLFVLGHQAVRGIARPYVAGRILAYTQVDKRATVLSMTSLAGRLLFALTGPAVGWLGEQGLLRSLAVQGLALALVFTALGLLHRRLPEKYFHVKAGVG